MITHPRPRSCLLVALLLGIVPLSPLGAIEPRDKDPAPSGVKLPVDPGLQQIVEKEVAQANAELHAQRIIAILADPKTGQILALAGTRDSASRQDESVLTSAVDDAVAFNYEPAGAFKPVTCAGFLASGLGEENTPAFCVNGEFPVGGQTIKDIKPYGNLTPLEILKTASNIGAAKMALQLGTEKYLATVESFGFGRKTGIDLPGESEGLLLPANRIDELTLARMGFGQAVTVTPIQVLMAYAAIANGGLLPHPALRKDSNSPLPVRILPEAVVASVRKALLTTDDLRLARVEGLTFAGKTGSGQALTPEGSYAKDQHVATFAGWFPAENPKIVGIVVVDQAKVEGEVNYGGLIAAPIFSKIAAKASAYLHIADASRTVTFRLFATSNGSGRAECRATEVMAASLIGTDSVISGRFSSLRCTLPSYHQ